MIRKLIALTLFAPAVLSAQALEPPGPRAPYNLTEIASYGSEEYTPRSGDDQLTRAAGGDMFGHVTDLRTGPGGKELFVLDNLGRKLVAITPDGRTRVVLRWREGKGPGEMTRPRGFAFTAEGIVVVDQSEPRLSFFSRDGELLRIQRVAARGLAIIETSSGFALLRTVIIPDREQVILLSAEGIVTDSVIPVSGRIADFTPFGEPGQFYFDRARVPRLAGPVAGLVCSLEAPSRCSGTDLFPNVRGRIEDRRGVAVRGVDIGVRGAAQLGSGETVILVMTKSTRRQLWQFWFLVFDTRMKYLGHIPVGDGWYRHMTQGFGDRDILVAADEPFPRIVRYEITRK